MNIKSANILFKFENRHGEGIVLHHMVESHMPYVVHSFSHYNGANGDLYWGHYFADEPEAEKYFFDKITEFKNY